MLEHLFTPGAREVKPDELSREFFARFERAAEADPERGRYEAWILRFCVRRT